MRVKGGAFSAVVEALASSACVTACVRAEAVVRRCFSK